MLDCLPMELLCVPSAYERVLVFDRPDEGVVDVHGKPILVSDEAMRDAGATIAVASQQGAVKTPVSYFAKVQSGGATIYYSRFCVDAHCGFELLVVDRKGEADAERCGIAPNVFAVDGVDADGLRRALASIRIRLASGAPESWPTLDSLPPSGEVDPDTTEPVEALPDC